MEAERARGLALEAELRVRHHHKSREAFLDKANEDQRTCAKGVFEWVDAFLKDSKAKTDWDLLGYRAEHLIKDLEKKPDKKKKAEDGGLLVLFFFIALGVVVAVQCSHHKRSARAQPSASA